MENVFPEKAWNSKNLQLNSEGSTDSNPKNSVIKAFWYKNVAVWRGRVMNLRK